MSYGGKTGDWGRARRATGPAQVAKIKGVIRRAVRREAERLRAEIVVGITRQAPGGLAFRPLSPLTIARRRAEGFAGTKALIRTGELRRSIATVQAGDAVFVGIPLRSGGGEKMVRIGQVHEFGSNPIIIPRGRRNIAVQIPARPFLRPAFKAWRVGVGERIARYVAQQMGWAA